MVILLFSSSNWEKDGLKRCFLDLIGRNVKEESPTNAAVGADSPPNPMDDDAQQPLLPVKQCLASSIHAVAHMRDPNVASVGADSPPNPMDATAQQQQLPVKQCLASSIHTVSLMLGPNVASRDAAFLATFKQSFL